MKSFILSFFCSVLSVILISTKGFAQNVGIGTATPNPSAALDINSSGKGLLIPRLDSNSRKAIVSPANALMVFDTDTKSFWYYTNTWNEVVGTSRTVAFDVTVKTSTIANSSPVLFDSIIYNIGGGYIYSAPFLSLFQAPQEGYYHFDILLTSSLSSITVYQISLYKTSGVTTTRPITTLIRPTGSLQETHGYSTGLLLQKNDIVKLWIEGISATVIGPDKTRFSGFKVF
jgi:hypothetical protein